MYILISWILMSCFRLQDRYGYWCMTQENDFRGILLCSSLRWKMQNCAFPCFSLICIIPCFISLFVSGWLSYKLCVVGNSWALFTHYNIYIFFLTRGAFNVEPYNVSVNIELYLLYLCVSLYHKIRNKIGKLLPRNEEVSGCKNQFTFIFHRRPS